jgi:hypothetical protein
MSALRFLDLAHHRLPAGFYDGRESNHIHILSDKGSKRFDLIFLLLLSVGELEIDAAFGGLGLD